MTYLIVSGVTLLGAFIVGALVYLLILSSGLQRASKGFKEDIVAYRKDLDSYTAEIYREIEIKGALFKKDLEDLNRDREQAITAVYQEIGTKVQTLVNQHEKAQSDVDRRIDEESADLGRRVDEAFSHADSRFDQLLNKVEKDYVQKTLNK
jgi:uncharacterized membrane-anchored protein YhcB (DUF1043 family)